MIKHIVPLPFTEEWCEHCKKHCTGERDPFLVTSDNPKMKNIVLCKCCIDLALNEQGILPEEF